MNKIIKPLSQITQLNNAIFLAGPTPRCGMSYQDDCEWREEAINLFRKHGFVGDIIDPINRKWNEGDLVNQIKWQREAMYKASLIFFWIPRTEEHPAFTTNVQFGSWLNNKSVVLGYPKHSIKNDYLKIRNEIDNYNPTFEDLESMVKWSINYLQNRKEAVYFTSDTHFSQERTLTLSARPFKNIEDMDLNLISNWNKKITMNDIVYHLGDFGNQDIVKLLNFKKMYFVPGNYEDKEGYKKLASDSRVVVLEQKVNPFDGNIVLPQYIDNEHKANYSLVHQPIGNVNLLEQPTDINEFFLFGHIHRLQIIKRNGINVGTDCYHFTPISSEEIWFLRNGIQKHFDENVFKEFCF